MAFAGIVVTLVGFLLAAGSVGLMGGTGGRLVLVLIGLVVSLFGIFALINPAYQKDAVWKK
jgi:uncharacterized membrane protein YgaE (UPF0421/DUF939 family)